MIVGVEAMSERGAGGAEVLALSKRRWDGHYLYHYANRIAKVFGAPPNHVPTTRHRCA